MAKMEEIDLQTVRVGTSGYQFADWYGSVYPEKLKQRDVLEYYSHVLGLASVEINYTYYRLPSARTSAAMAQKVPDEFDFTVRSYSEMTHEIWADRERKVLKDTSEIFDRFIEGIAPLKEAGKLGSVLLQFPYSFWPNRTTFGYLRFCQEKLADLEVVIEFRNRGWMRESS